MHFVSCPRPSTLSQVKVDLLFSKGMYEAKTFTIVNWGKVQRSGLIYFKYGWWKFKCPYLKVRWCFPSEEHELRKGGRVVVN